MNALAFIAIAATALYFGRMMAERIYKSEGNTMDAKTRAVTQALELACEFDLPETWPLKIEIGRMGDKREVRITLLRPCVKDYESFVGDICICDNKGCLESVAERTRLCLDTLYREATKDEIEFTVTPEKKP